MKSKVVGSSEQKNFAMKSKVNGRKRSKVIDTSQMKISSFFKPAVCVCSNASGQQHRPRSTVNGIVFGTVGQLPDHSDEDCIEIDDDCIEIDDDCIPPTPDVLRPCDPRNSVSGGLEGRASDTNVVSKLPFEEDVLDYNLSCRTPEASLRFLKSPDCISPSQGPIPKATPDVIPPTPTELQVCSRGKVAMSSLSRIFGVAESSKCRREILSSNAPLSPRLTKRPLYDDEEKENDFAKSPRTSNKNISKLPCSKRDKIGHFNWTIEPGISNDFLEHMPVGNGAKSDRPINAVGQALPRTEDPHAVPAFSLDCAMLVDPVITHTAPDDLPHQPSISTPGAINDLVDSVEPKADDVFVEAVSGIDWNAVEFENLPPVKLPKSVLAPVDFGRHTVMSVKSSSSEGCQEVELVLWSDNFARERRCILKGFWTDTVLHGGDVVNVLAHFDEDHCAVLDDASGLLVVHPDLLVSSTAVTSTLFCQRKAVLSEWFRGLDPGNTHMFIGNVVHRLFQDALTRHMTSEEELRQHLGTVLGCPENMLEMYKHGVQDPVKWNSEQLDAYVKEIVVWMNTYLERPARSEAATSFGRRRRHSSSDVTISRVHDIEENIWSPRIGVKGKIDLTVEVKVHRWDGSTTSKVVPLELKTGRSSFSAEHRGQVVLYSMMFRDRRDDPEGGLLLYLRDGQQKVISVDRQCMQGLVQRRNELAQYLATPLVDVGTHLEAGRPPNSGRSRLAPLPRPLADEKLCRKCPYLTTCAVYNGIEEVGTIEPDHPFTSVAARAAAHLGPADHEYFSRWCTYLFLERRTTCDPVASTRDVWSVRARDRESRGEGFSDMVLSPVDDVPEVVQGDGRVLHRFIRQQDVPRPLGPLNEAGLSVRTTVVVSIEERNLVSLAMGCIETIAESSVDVWLDRNLYGNEEWRNAVFRIDVSVSQVVVATCLSNVARLMANDPVCGRLRSIVVGRQPASFRDRMGKDPVLKGRRVLRSLNKEQVAAVIRVLMADDYLLIKGMPGAGKTATVVALVRILHELGHTVLLTSHTHSAVDNILLKLQDQGLDFLRLGTASRVHPKLLGHTVEHLMRSMTSLDALDSLLRSTKIVATTCLGSSHAIFSRHRQFDYCVVDEASQVLQPECLGPLFHCRKFVLVGDSRQLSPVIRSTEARNLGMDESLFSRLDSPASTVELTTQYRMNSEIMRLANALSYDGALKCATEEVAGSVLRLPNVGVCGEADGWLRDVASSDLDKSVLMLNTDAVPAPECRDGRRQLCNKTEVLLVVGIVRFLTKAGLDAGQLGVICPYRNQVVHIARALASDGIVTGGDGIEVNTVDQYQGRDKDVIVVSCVRSGRTASQENKSNEILGDVRRINVAITRARKKLVLVGSSSTLLHYSPMAALLAALRPHQEISLPPAGAMYSVV